MSRKTDAKSKDNLATVTVDIADFTRTRDSVIVNLATLQSAVQDLSRAYINHANTVLNRGPGGGPTLDLGLTSTLLENGLLGQRTASPGEGIHGVETKKKRKRAPHDPNAPKRALTPYFLYMQTARAKIAAELGENAKPKDVADEGTRRWAAMSEADKKTWTAAYAHNLAIYREKMKAYKAGKPVPDDDEAAKQLQSAVASAADLAADEVPTDDDDDEDEVSPEPVKAPSPPKPNKRRKTVEAKPATPAKEVPASPAAAKKASPEKKKKTTKKEDEMKKADEDKAGDKKKTKKKRKSENMVSED